MKKIAITLGVLVVCVCVYFHIQVSTRPVIIGTAFGISSVVQKNSDGDNYYLTVKLDDYYKFSNKTPTFQTNQSIYDSVDVGVDYVGVSLEITTPREGYYSIDSTIYEVLEGEQYQKCEITGITAIDNTVYR